MVRAALASLVLLLPAYAAAEDPPRATAPAAPSPSLSNLLSIFGRTPETADPTRIPETLIDKEAPWGPMQIVVYKSRRKLMLYRHGKLDREYPVVLGLKPLGRKRFAHDARTPEGKYRIVEKRPHERWQYFLAIDYPNDDDKAVYAAELAGGKIPVVAGEPFEIGSGLGIHGNDKPAEQTSGTDWTKGCVAMRDADIAELYSLVEVGTPVWLVE